MTYIKVGYTLRMGDFIPVVEGLIESISIYGRVIFWFCDILDIWISARRKRSITWWQYLVITSITNFCLP